MYLAFAQGGGEPAQSKHQVQIHVVSARRGHVFEGGAVAVADAGLDGIPAGMDSLAMVSCSFHSVCRVQRLLKWARNGRDAGPSRWASSALGGRARGFHAIEA